MSFADVEAAWDLAVRASTFGRDGGGRNGAGRDLGDYWRAIFASDARVDVARTMAEGGSAPARIYLTSPYGVMWRPASRDWVPFRHGEITLPPLDLE